MNIDFENFNKNIYYKVSEFIIDSGIKLAPHNNHYGNENIKVLMPDWLKELLKQTILSEVENLGKKGNYTFCGYDVFPNYEDKIMVYLKRFNKGEKCKLFELNLEILFSE